MDKSSIRMGVGLICAVVAVGLIGREVFTALPALFGAAQWDEAAANKHLLAAAVFICAALAIRPKKARTTRAH
jgi:ABC-type uncharacterized transport system permease subunit